MSRKFKLTLLASMLAVGLSSPVFAQARSSNNDTAAGLDEVVFHQAIVNGGHARTILADYSDDPSMTGGGSSGYNNHLNKNYV